MCNKKDCDNCSFYNTSDDRCYFYIGQIPTNVPFERICENWDTMQPSDMITDFDMYNLLDCIKKVTEKK